MDYTEMSDLSSDLQWRGLIGRWSGLVSFGARQTNQIHWRGSKAS
jgi:hypothetical protein